jgi:hypothetical protein
MTIHALAILTLRPEARAAALRAQLQALSDTASASGAPLLAEAIKPNINGGDLIWRQGFSARDDAAIDTLRALAADPAVAAVDWAVFESIGAGDNAPQTPGGAYRQLTLSVVDGTPASVTERFERETAAMPDHISTILRWRLSRVLASGGARNWTHVWEQEYAGPEGFQGEYMNHPYHWGFIDRWFDIEAPDRIVDRRISNSLCRIDRRVLD